MSKIRKWYVVGLHAHPMSDDVMHAKSRHCATVIMYTKIEFKLNSIAHQMGDAAISRIRKVSVKIHNRHKVTAGILLIQYAGWAPIHEDPKSSRRSSELTAGQCRMLVDIDWLHICYTKQLVYCNAVMGFQLFLCWVRDLKWQEDRTVLNCRDRSIASRQSQTK